MTNISYVLAARKGDLFSTLNGVADKVANANTISYKPEKNIFGEIVKNTKLNENVSFSHIRETKRETEQGALKSTGRALDTAIIGKGYFMVDTPLGRRFTRAGNFQINNLGQLVTEQGYPLVGPGGGAVEFAVDDTNIKIADDGIVTANGEGRGQIGLFDFADEQALKRVGQNYYIAQGQDPQPAEQGRISQGMVENSAVNAVFAMTEMIDVSRKIESIKRMEKGHHDLQKNMLRKLTQK